MLSFTLQGRPGHSVNEQWTSLSKETTVWCQGARWVSRLYMPHKLLAQWTFPWNRNLCYLLLSSTTVHLLIIFFILQFMAYILRVGGFKRRKQGGIVRCCHGCHIMYRFKIMCSSLWCAHILRRLSYSASYFIELCEVLHNQHGVIVYYELFSLGL